MGVKFKIIYIDNLIDDSVFDNGKSVEIERKTQPLWKGGKWKLKRLI